ncbi:MAG: thiosulfate oxidation carrier complex protein SoxZ [Burkholderiaceae bacterium]
MARALITMPKTAKHGDVIEIRALIAHPMETGFRPDALGKVLPRDIITTFTCRYGDEVVFSAQLHSAIAANPYIAFFVTATASADLTFTWEGDNGFAQKETVALTVT